MKARIAVAALGATAVMIFANTLVARQAAAAPADGPYLRLEAGGLFPNNSAISTTTGPTFRITPNDAPAAGAALGLRLTPFRLEIEGLWMRSPTSGNAGGISGRLTNIPAMANVYLDINSGGKLEPYVGFGFGASFVSLKGSTASAGQIDSSTHVFAFQPILGVNYNMTDQVAVGLQYRYFKTVDPWLTTGGGQRFSFSNSSHIVLATLTYHFLAPQAKAAEMPAAPTAPGMRKPVPALGLALAPAAHQPAHVYLVFFDFDSARLSAAGRRAADEVVIAYRQDPSGNIVVSGYTDLVGSDGYNLALSKRRAMTVYDYFVAQGVKPTDMGVEWYGKANPRVPTPQKEPQNRRVEIRM
jgi:outer membrane protein OmpA-like peptidoglycan-associated protein/opacity protein-like surface antigen